MNAFGLNIDDLDSDICRHELADNAEAIDRLPGVPALLSRSDCAHIASVSMPTIDRLIESGELSELSINGDSGILKSDLLALIDRNFLYDKPILDGAV